jgi:hypothetical protein
MISVEPRHALVRDEARPPQAPQLGALKWMKQK